MGYLVFLLLVILLFISYLSTYQEDGFFEFENIKKK